MTTQRQIGGRTSAATFALRFLPLIEVEPNSENLGAQSDSARCSLKSGIEIAAYKCGVFVFDCTKWALGAEVAIPKMIIEDGKAWPRELVAAQDKAIEHVVNRVRMANCFLACLSHALSRVQGTALGIGQEVDPSNYIPFAINGCHPFALLAPEVEIALQQLGNQRPNGNPTLKFKFDTIKSACDTLDKIIANAEATNVVDLYYKACYRYTLHDHALSATIAWTVCEKAINMLWRQYLESIKAMDLEPIRMKGERLKKLIGRDYTASIVTENLELLKIIDQEIYAELNSARQVRNGWMHSLKGVGNREASQALTTAYKMIKMVYEIDVQVSLSQSMSY